MTSESSSPRLRTIRFSSLVGAALCLMILAFGLYGHTMSYPFVHDDHVFILHNPYLRHLDHWGDLFLARASSLPASFDNANTYYRPMLEVMNRVFFYWFGEQPGGYHLVNVVVHGLNAMMIFVTGCLMTLPPLLAFVLSVVFVVHPVHSQAVCAIAGISNLLAAFFCLASFCGYLRLRQQPQGHSRYFYATGTGVLFALALFSKESVVTFPFVLGAYEYFYGTAKKGSSPWARGVTLCTIVGIPLVIYIGLRHAAAIKLPAIWEYPQELWLRIFSMPRTLLMYGRLLIAPVDLHYYRSVNILDAALAPTVILGCCAFAWGRFRRTLDVWQRRQADFGLAWFLLLLLPMLNILPLINEYALIMTAEHFLYLPSFGFLLMAAVVAQALSQNIPQPQRLLWGSVLCIVLVVSFSMLSRAQSRFWRGEIPLFEQTVRHQPRLGRGYWLLGRAYYFTGDDERAIAAYRRALEIIAGYAAQSQGTKALGTYEHFQQEIYFELAQSYARAGQGNQSLAAYQECLKLSPGDDRVYNNLGMHYLALGDLRRARGFLRKAVRYNPRNVLAKNNLAYVYAQQGKRTRAQSMLAQLLRYDATCTLTRQNLEFLRTSHQLVEPQAPEGF